MGEQIIQNNLKNGGIPVGEKYEYYNLGQVTIKQLKSSKIINKKDYGLYEDKKPDNLLIDRRNRKNISVIAVLENKSTEEFNTKNKKEKAAKQCNSYCRALNARIGIITDGIEYIWINPNKDIDKCEVIYNESELWGNLDNKSGFDYIKREDGYSLSTTCNFFDTKNNVKLIKIIEKAINNIDNDNSQIKQESSVNPSELAKSIWQDVWISKSASPEKSLSTFIEIFMLKFLSDLKVLVEDEDGSKVDFDTVMDKGKHKCLKYYCKTVRPYIKNIFPKNEDDSTTLINGIALNPDIKEDNVVFYNILKKFSKFKDLTNIDLEFKSRLFEDFLKKSISKKNWGQFFTPRNVVKAIIEMSDIEKLPDKAKVCDPACGVGGFLLEPIITKRVNDYYFDKNKLKSKIIYQGYERGFEKDEKISTILAKANFVIYLSELLKENPTLTKEFSNMFNNVFKIYTDTILGSLSEVKKNEYDLIMSNPPYVTSGSGNIKTAIKEESKLKEIYKTNAIGLEGLFMIKIINELKIKGKALVVIPDGILNRINDKSLRAFIKEECIINAIISLPNKTFYTTSKKTYILSLTKKEDNKIPQISPIFTYLISDIGETLNVNRFPIPENDLKDMVREYRYFMVDKQTYNTKNPRCKIQNIEKFDENNHWLVDKWWSREEKINLKIIEDDVVLTEAEFIERTKDVKKRINKILSEFLGEDELENEAALAES